MELSWKPSWTQDVQTIDIISKQPTCGLGHNTAQRRSHVSTGTVQISEYHHADGRLSSRRDEDSDDTNPHLQKRFF